MIPTSLRRRVSRAQHERRSRNARRRWFYRLGLERLEQRTLLAGFPLAGQTGDVVPVDLGLVLPGTNFNLTSLQLVNKNETLTLQPTNAGTAFDVEADGEVI